MLDPRFLRQDIEQAAERLKARGFELNVAELQALEEKRKTLQVQTQELQNERNSRSKAIGQAKAKGEDIAPLLAAVSSLGDDLDAAKKRTRCRTCGNRRDCCDTS
jgi:seryl-tRNA synthetase